MRLIDTESPKIEQNVYREPLGTRYIPFWKRILDGACILISLPLTVPVFALVALWIKAVSPGPVFFRQERIGFRGKLFTMFKFRTMKVNVETAVHEKHFATLMESDVPMTKLDVLGDPRIIPGGKLLRALGIDELPQLLNVVRGEMSLVGPRPCTLREGERLQDWQRERTNTAPGLTGYWQVNGKNETTFTRMVEMDIWYSKNLSLDLDLEILFKTVPSILASVLKRKGKGKGKRVAPASEEIVPIDKIDFEYFSRLNTGEGEF